MKKLIFAAPVLFALAVACSDPPPPSLSRVTIDKVSNDNAIGYTYIRESSSDRLVIDPTKGVTLGDGLSVVLTTSRRISDPPEKDADADALLNKAFTLTVTGDAFTAVKLPQSSQIILHTVKTGEGSLVFSVEGATGTITMPVKVVEQGAVPSDVFPPDAPKPTPEASTEPETDGGTEGGI